MAVVGLTIGIGADASQFNKEINKMERNTKSISKDVNELSKSLQIEWDSKRFEQAQAKAQEAIAQTDVKAKALRDRLEYLDQVGTDNQSAHYQKVQNELVKTETKAVLLKRQLEELDSLKLERLTEGFKKTGQSIEQAGKELAPFSAVAAGLLASFAAIGIATVATADDIQTFADQLNLSAESMQKWNYIAMQTDVSQTELQTAFIKTQGALAALATDSGGSGADALKKLGFSMQEASLGMEANIDKIVTNLAEIPSEVEKAQIANEIFGARMGAKIIPLLNSGAQGLRELTEEFEAVGYMSNEQVKSLAEFDNIMNRLKQMIGNLKNEIGTALLPIMENLAEIVETRIIPVLRSIVDWFESLSDRTKTTMITTLAFIAALAPALIIIGKMTAGVGGLIKMFSNLSNSLTALSAHPAITIIAAVLGLIMLLYNTNENFKQSIDNLIGVLSQSFTPILLIISNTLKEVTNSLMPIINIFGNLLAGAIKSLMPVINLLLNLFMKYFVPYMQFVANIITTIFKTVEKVITSIMSFVEKMVNGIIDFINTLIRQINKLGSVIGVTISELDNVSLKMQGIENIKNVENISETPQFEAQEVIGNITTVPQAQSVVNNDYSNKDIKVEVVVQNYAEQVDVDDLVRRINIKLAEQI